MSDSPLKTLSDLAEQAHNKIQQTSQAINPILEVRSGMRSVGIPADVMTFDCLKTRRRIMLILHDEEPGVLLYQFITIEDEIAEVFERVALDVVDADMLVGWMQRHFGRAIN